jgi:hypothetical protein
LTCFGVLVKILYEIESYLAKKQERLNKVHRQVLVSKRQFNDFIIIKVGAICKFMWVITRHLCNDITAHSTECVYMSKACFINIALRFSVIKSGL